MQFQLTVSVDSPVTQLMDMSEKLWQIYTRLDAVSLETLLTEVTPHTLLSGFSCEETSTNKHQSQYVTHLKRFSFSSVTVTL